jgi:hypothetical protein
MSALTLSPRALGGELSGKPAFPRFDHDAGRLAAHDRAFVRDMANALICGGEPSERQGAWLRALFAKLKREAGQ